MSKCQFFFLNGLWRLLKNGHLPVKLHSSAPLRGQIISVTWSNKGENLSNCWSNGDKLITFTTGNMKDSDNCYIGDLGMMSGLKKYT